MYHTIIMMRRREGRREGGRGGFGEVEPHGLVIIKQVFGETAGVEDTEMAVDVGPGVGGRFAAVVESAGGEGGREGGREGGCE